MKRLPSKNRALMQRIDSYLQNKMECSMGEIEEELGIPVWKQYVILPIQPRLLPGRQAGGWPLDLGLPNTIATRPAILTGRSLCERE
jgi:hypothetical protein